jgi:hypothetical protein
MPSHFTHLIFAEEAVTAALGQEGRELLASHGNHMRFGAQGPDFFYHNQRTMPTGLRYGVLAHKHGYGTLVENMVREALRLSTPAHSELAAFIMGFATHAPLDRETHPYIGYFSGWVDPARPETRRYFHCHAFFERILDVLVLRERRGSAPADFDFLPQVRCGRALPYPVVKTLVKSLNATYPSMSYKSRDRRRVDNAYHDAIFFYKLTNHLTPRLHRLAYRSDAKDGFQHRRFALLHPVTVPEGYDFLNTSRLEWCHPCDPREPSTAGFMELYARALPKAAEMVRAVRNAISGSRPPEGLAGVIGNMSLDTGREPCPPVHCAPLPLPEILDEMYRRVSEELGVREAQGELAPGGPDAAPTAR